MTHASWEAYLESRFPAFLLRSTQRCRLDRAAAEAFLERLSLGGDNLRLLRGLSLFAAHERELHEFATYWLPELVRALPSGARVEQRTWRGGYQGRLDVPATLQLRASGDGAGFVTRARRRRFDLPENVFIRSLVGRTERLASELAAKKFLHGKGWTRGVVDALAELRFITRSSLLRDVREEPIAAYHLQAARNARHPAYRSALRWYEALADALDHDDPERLAKLLSEGGLQPAEEPRRFELAVLLALLDAIDQHLASDPAYEVERTFIAADRQQVATFTRASGTCIDVYYNQAVLPLDERLGPRDHGVRHYLDRSGRLRPDITVCVAHPDGRRVYTVFEIKLSRDLGYVSSGYSEAIVYRHEYAQYLTGWPKAVLVTSGPLQGKPRLGDDVVAVAWNDLAASPIIASMLDASASVWSGAGEQVAR